jgi:hypothetical protein
MRPSAFRLSAAIVFAGVLGLPAVQGQDFQRNYTVAPGGYIRVGNISGRVVLTGYDGDVVSVSAFKEGRDRDMIDVEDRSAGDRVDVRARFPENCNCSASLRFEVKVPRAHRYTFDRLGSVSGDVEVSGVQGKLRAESVSGNVRVRDVTGVVSASTVSGDVEVEINKLEGAGDMKFSSVSGDVHVRVPVNLDADIEMSSLSGSLKTDFPIEIQERRYGPGRSARARLGAGTRVLKLSTVSGRVSLSRI